MPENLIVSTPSAYSYPLLVKQLLINSLSLYGDQEITYRGELRYTYRDFRRRVGQLASALEGLGVRHGTTVAVMDWDSHRYLESYFAIPMMGATLFTVNVRVPFKSTLPLKRCVKFRLLVTLPPSVSTPVPVETVPWPPPTIFRLPMV